MSAEEQFNDALAKAVAALRAIDLKSLEADFAMVRKLARPPVMFFRILLPIGALLGQFDPSLGMPSASAASSTPANDDDGATATNNSSATEHPYVKLSDALLSIAGCGPNKPSPDAHKALLQALTDYDPVASITPQQFALLESEYYFGQRPVEIPSDPRPQGPFTVQRAQQSLGSLAFLVKWLEAVRAIGHLVIRVKPRLAAEAAAAAAARGGSEEETPAPEGRLRFPEDLYPCDHLATKSNATSASAQVAPSNNNNTPSSELEALHAETMKALESLQLRSVGELHSFPQPPLRVAEVVGAVALLLGEPDGSWMSCKRVLSDASFIKRLKAFDPRGDVSEAAVAAAAKATEAYSQTEMARASAACAVFYQWLVLVVKTKETMKNGARSD